MRTCTSLLLRGVVVVLVGCGGGAGTTEMDAETGGATSESTSAATDGAEVTGVPTSGSGGEMTTMDGSSGGTTSGEGTTGPLVCTAPPLTEEQVQALAFGVFGNGFEMQPGDQRMVRLGVAECCYFIEEIDACVEYTLSPAEGASYDAASGLLTIAEDVVAGTVYTLTADVEDGRAVVAATITVYTPEANPLVGVWREAGQTPCGGGDEVPAEPSIGELRFWANGEVMVTWEPFEVYVDYWGTYTFDLESGALDIMIDDGNYVPPDVDGVGSFAALGAELFLGDMWLGSAQQFMGEVACGHRFAR